MIPSAPLQRLILARAAQSGSVRLLSQRVGVPWERLCSILESETVPVAQAQGILQAIGGLTRPPNAMDRAQGGPHKAHGERTRRFTPRSGHCRKGLHPMPESARKGKGCYACYLERQRRYRAAQRGAA